jgi:hypothetical protein
MGCNFSKGRLGRFTLNKGCKLILINLIYNMKIYWQCWIVQLLKRNLKNYVYFFFQSRSLAEPRLWNPGIDCQINKTHKYIYFGLWSLYKYCPPLKLSSCGQQLLHIQGDTIVQYSVRLFGTSFGAENGFFRYVTISKLRRFYVGVAFL